MPLPSPPCAPPAPRRARNAGSPRLPRVLLSALLATLLCGCEHAAPGATRRPALAWGPYKDIAQEWVPAEPRIATRVGGQRRRP